MKITYLGHSCLQIETNGKTLIVDPFISANPLASSIDVNMLRADYILITHAHIDHVLDVETIAQNSDNCQLISNYEIVEYYINKGLQGHHLNHGGKKEFDFGLVKYVNAVHSSMFPDGSYGGNAGGFVIANDNATVYISGDTALTKDMELIPMFFPKIDLCVFPIGDNFTMGYEDARIASDFVNCNRVLGVHYDSFPPIEIDKEEAKSYFAAENRELILLEIGEHINV